MKQHCYRVEKGKARYCVDVEDLRAWLTKESVVKYSKLLAELEEEAGK